MVVKNKPVVKNYISIFELFFIDIKKTINMLTYNVYLQHTCEVSKKQFFIISFVLVYSLSNIFGSILDIFYSSLKDKSMFVYNFIYFLKDVKLSILLDCKGTTNQFYSLSHILFNSIWLEREVSEFSELYFKNLEDTRRLLLDYTIKKEEITNEGIFSTYNNIFHEFFN